MHLRVGPIRFVWIISISGSFIPGNTSVESRERVRHTMAPGLKLRQSIISGRAGTIQSIYAEAVLSDQAPFQNYFGTIINAPALLPLQDGRSLILENSGLSTMWRVVCAMCLRCAASWIFALKPTFSNRLNT